MLKFHKIKPKKHHIFLLCCCVLVLCLVFTEHHANMNLNFCLFALSSGELNQILLRLQSQFADDIPSKTPVSDWAKRF